MESVLIVRLDSYLERNANLETIAQAFEDAL
jgi:hypothetical protein